MEGQKIPLPKPKKKELNHPNGYLSSFGAGRGVFTFGEDTRTLRLKSELFDLRVGYANPILRLGESQRGVREPLTVAKK
jgi:hypothetical protein